MITRKEVFCILIVFSAVSSSGRLANQNICKLDGCANTNPPPKSPVFDACKLGSIDGRCCYINNNITIIGLDLSHCNITNLNLVPTTDGSPLGFRRQSLEILVLTDNPIQEYSKDAFDGFSQLKLLMLPVPLTCPGGREAWKEIPPLANITICKEEENLCDNEHKNETCPSNSHCVMHSPGVNWCECNEGFYGYKCLRTGTFNMAAFLGGIMGGAATVSILLWVVFRRKTKQP